MRVFLVLVWREVFERRLLLLASVFLGWIPIVVPLLPVRPERFSPEELRTGILVVLLALFGCAVLLILGATIVGRDLSEGRLGFYFSRPISGWALWGSRLVATCALLLASLFLIAAPTVALDLGQWIEDLSGRGGSAWPLLAKDEVFLSKFFLETLPERPPLAIKLALALGTILLLVTATHAVSTIVRGRSIWVLADLAGLSVCVAVIWAARDVLVREQAIGALVWAEWFLLLWALGSLLVAGGVQITRGRTDLRRGHRFLSVTLWPALIAGALALGVYARWMATSTLEDLEELSLAHESPDEDWLVAGGGVRHRAGAAAAFLLDVRSGESWRLGSLNVVRFLHAYSADGSTLVWARCAGFRPLDCELWVKNLHDEGSPPRRTGVPIISGRVRMALSPDGRRLAMTEARRVVAYELSSGRLLMAVDTELPEAVYFASNRLVRYHHALDLKEGWRTRIWELDLDSRQSSAVGELPRGILLRRNPSRDAILFKRYFPSGFGLYQGQTGEPLFELDERWDQLPSRGRFLADGRIVLSVHEDGVLTLLVLSPDGEEHHRIECPGATDNRFGGELSPGRVLVGLRELGNISERLEAPLNEEDEDLFGRYIGTNQASVSEFLGGWATYELDAESGELTRLADGAMPLGAPEQMLDQRLLWTADGKVVQWRPETGERRILLPR